MKKYTNIFEIKKIPEEIEKIQHTRRSRQWEYTFKSLNNVGIKLTVDNKTTEINNLDSEVDKIMNVLNDSNRENFINELSEIYVASKLSTQTLDDTKMLDMHFGRLERDQKYLDKRNEIINSIKSQGTKVGIYKMIQEIAYKYMGVDRKTNMELDNLFLAYGLFQHISSLNNFMTRYPDDELTVLSKTYMRVMEKKYLSLINNPLDIITSKNFNEENVVLAWPLSSISKCFDNKYPEKENSENVDPNGSFYNLIIKDIKGVITEQCNLIYENKDEEIEIVEKLLYGKLNALNREVLYAKNKYVLDDIPDIKQFQNGINIELNKLKNINDPIKFYNKVKAFEEAHKSIDDVVCNTRNIGVDIIKVDGIVHENANDQSINNVKDSFAKLEKALQDNGIYNDEIKVFFEKIFDWFISLFTKQIIKIENPKEKLSPMTCGPQELATQKNPYNGVPPLPLH